VTDWPLRAVDPAEHDALAAMWHAAWHDGHAAIVPPGLVALRQLADFKTRMPGIAPLARTAGPKGAPLGFCAVRKDELYQLFVADKARGTGLAARLLADGEARLREGGYAEGFLDCQPDNIRALRFYQRLGWSIDSPALVTLETASGGFELETLILRKSL